MQNELLHTALVRFFERAAKPQKHQKLGIELEHFVLQANGHAAMYGGPNGVRDVVCELMSLYPDAQAIKGEDLLGFSVREFTITLEPAAQLEISIAPKEDLADIARIYREFASRLQRVLNPRGLKLHTAGCQPYSAVRTLPLIPKERYRLMDVHFAHTGTGGIEMMRGTASTQVSIDFFSAEDFRRKWQAAYFFTPLFKLLTDNSPYFEGHPVKTPLKRTDIWRRTDAARCGAVPEVFKPEYSFADYAHFLENMPLIFVPQDDACRPTGSQTAAKIWAGKNPTEAEILHILSMAFPDVRLKKYIEIRGADSLPLPYVLAYGALIKGLLYAEPSLDFAQEEIARLALDNAKLTACENDLMAHGWHGQIYDKPAREFAWHALDTAARYLAPADAAHLAAFRPVIECGGILAV